MGEGPLFVNVTVLPVWRTDRLVAVCGRPYGSRLDANVAVIGLSKATTKEPHLSRYLRAAGVAYRIKVTMRAQA